MALNTEKQLSEKELEWLHKKLDKAEPYDDGDEPPLLYDENYPAEIEARIEATYAKRMLKKYGYL